MEGEGEGERENEIERERERERDRCMYETETAASPHGAEHAMVNEAIRGMEAVLFNAASEGNVKIIIEMIEPRVVQTTPTGKTVLHIASEFNRDESVREILKRDRRLLIRVDRRRDTALHVAARMGNFGAAEALIKAAKAKDPDIESGDLTTTVEEFIRMTNNKDNTALHEAVDVKFPSVDIVRMLVQEYRGCEYLPNKRSETPLYVAAERGHQEVALEILKLSSSAQHDGPIGRTTLHAAVMSDLGGLTEKLLNREHALVKRADNDGWTPLHWAAYFDRSHRVGQLLEHDPKLAYIMDKDGLISLHVASMRNSIHSMEIITSKCPDCYDMVDHKGRNTFHYAVMHEKYGSVAFLLRGYLFRSLFNEGDKEGNTALHLLAPRQNERFDHIMSITSVIDWKSLNNNNETFSSLRDPFAKGIIRRLRAPKSSREVRKEKKSRKESGDRGSSDMGNHLVGATLIATVSFAAGFTLPGGYSDSGKAILSSKPAFKAFVISNTLAFLFSVALLFVQFYIPLVIPKIERWNPKAVGAPLMPLAMLSTLIAFITGVSVALESSGLNIALQTISVFISLMFFLYIWWIRKRLLSLFRKMQTNKTS